MKFNEEQKAFWKTHTRPEVSSKVQKLVMLRTIAHDQEKAGLHFDGRRSFAQAEVDLLQEQLIQTSQAARVQNPLKVIGEAAKNLAQSLGNYFEGMPSIEEAVRLDQLAELNANQEKAIEASSKKRDQTYFHKIYTSTQEMKPGAILFYQMGRGHFRELQRKLNGITGIVVEIDESATTAKKEEL